MIAHFRDSSFGGRLRRLNVATIGRFKLVEVEATLSNTGLSDVIEVLPSN